jgi:hypothetical protein
VDERDDETYSRAPEPQDLVRLGRSLNSAGARYVSYQDVIADAEAHRIDDVTVPVASPETLIRTKDTYRPQDAIDREFLQGLIRDRASGGDS